MLEASCPNCGYYSYGWALTSPRQQARNFRGRPINPKGEDYHRARGVASQQ
ncbi:unnamed protein product [marine sediment metagenome]|uniref:Uncharacterized protein n=1 Tax=marine sediment metagenome TaxID=412755 RepID=X1LCW7_9ZZZZ